MNNKQQKFVTEYLQWGIPSLAYANAYNKSDPNGRAIESAANRLLRNPEVKQAIHDAEDRIRHQVEREIADRQALDVFTIEQKRHLLKQIATGDMLVEQRYKTGDCRHCTQFIRPTINQMLRAIDLDNRMSAHYPPPQHKTTTKRSVLVATTDKDINTATANKKDSFPACSDSTSPAFIPPMAGGAGGNLAPDTREQQNTTDNKTENTTHKTRLPFRGIGGQPAPDTSVEQQNTTTDNKTENTTHKTRLPLRGIGGNLAPDTREQQNTTDNKISLPFRGIGGNLAPDTLEQHYTTTNKKDSFPVLREGGFRRQEEDGRVDGVMTHDELMELLYPKEEKLQQKTTSYNHLPENIQLE